MYTTCPECGYLRRPEDGAARDRCPGCGLIFSKWLSRQVEQHHGAGITPDAAPVGDGSPWLSRFLFYPRAGVGTTELAGYGLLWLVFALWGMSFVLMDFRSAEIMQSWFHNVDLIFHEAGHVVFSPFGRTLTLLGGSLFQVLVPLGLMLAFLVRNRDGFAASLCLWWAGQSLMDLAPYIADASRLRLPLLGGGTGMDSPGMHDWANLLRPRGWLRHDETIAAAVDFAGELVLLCALAWGAYMLLLYARNRGGQPAAPGP